MNWTAISALTTGGGTLVLAVATFASVRSAQRAARVSERALLAGLRPVLMPSRLNDAPQKVSFMEGEFFHVEGGHAVVRVEDGVIYLVATLRNEGNGIAVLHSFALSAESDPVSAPDHTPIEEFRRLGRDIYISAGSDGFWQGALRDPEEPVFSEIANAVEERRRITVEILYGDHEGGQRTVSRFSLLPADEQDWLTVVSRHWNIDREDPR